MSRILVILGVIFSLGIPSIVQGDILTKAVVAYAVYKHYQNKKAEAREQKQRQTDRQRQAQENPLKIEEEIEECERLGYEDCEY